MRRRTILLTTVLAGSGILVGTVGIGGSSAQTGSITVTAREFSFRAPSSLGDAGRKAITVRNRGQFPHDFTIVRGPRRFATRTIAPGRSQRITRNLPAGAYLAICTVRDGGHMAGGMVKTFTAGTQDQATGVWR